MRDNLDVPRVRLHGDGVIHLVEPELARTVYIDFIVKQPIPPQPGLEDSVFAFFQKARWRLPVFPGLPWRLRLHDGTVILRGSPEALAELSTPDWQIELIRSTPD
jgi:hypothetical protein